MPRRTSLLAGLLLTVAGLGWAQEYAFHSLTVNDGLSQNHVDAIAQDHDGFLWVGTANGLNRYDGQRIVTFRHEPEDPTSLVHDTVSSLFVDNQGTLWVGTGAGISRMGKTVGRFETFQNVPGDPSTIAPGRAASLASDRHETMWVATNQPSYPFEQPTAGVVNRIDTKTGTAQRFPLDIDAGEVATLHVDASGTLWVGTIFRIHRRSSERAGLFRFDAAKKTFSRVFLAGNPDHGTLPVFDIIGDRRGKLLLATGGRGIAEFDPHTHATRWLGDEVASAELGEGSSVFDLALDEGGVVWAVGSPPHSRPGLLSFQRQLLRIEPAGGGVAKYDDDPANPFAVGDGLMQVVFADRFGTVWIGTSGSGLRYADVAAPAFSLYRHNAADANSLSSNFVRSVLAESDDRIWVGTLKGLDLIDRRTRTVRHWVHERGNAGSILPGTVNAIFRDSRAQLWVAVDTGLHRFDPDRGGVQTYIHQQSEMDGLNDEAITAVAESDDGALWLAIRGQGLTRLDPASGEIRHFTAMPGDDTALPNDAVVSIRDRPDGRFWVLATKGLVDLDPETGRLQRVLSVSDVVGGRAERIFSCLHVDPGPPEVLWIGTDRGGLCRFVPETMAIEVLDLRQHGVVDNSIYQILPDDDGRLWMSTDFGLLRFDPNTDSYRLFASGRGLQAPEFNRHASHRGPTGELFFGGVEGLNAFHPETIVDNPFPPDVVITEVAILRRDTTQAGTPREVVYRLGQSPTLHRLAANQRDLAFDFVALHYSDTARNTVAYRLDGFETTWHEGQSLRTATYTNLDPGSYTFMVKAANADGVWNENGATFEIEILKPLMGQLWFQLSILLAVAAAGYSASRLRVAAIKKREHLLEARVLERTAELEQAVTTIRDQAERLEELDEAKSRFFANVSHEFRTPLTLTIGPLEDLHDGFYGELPGAAVDDIEVAIRNARRLLRLVNQLLDMAKLEAGHLRLCAGEIDLPALVTDVADSFSPLAARRGITIQNEAEGRSLQIVADAEMLDQVFTNIMSNAFKFTPDDGRIQVRVREAQARGLVTVEIQDSGKGIAAEFIPHIFDRFHSANEAISSTQVGTGIGLAFAKELVELHGGEISVRSVEGLGTTMSVVLKTGRAQTGETSANREIPDAPATWRDHQKGASPAPTPAATAAREPTHEAEEDLDRTTILVVDDSEDIRSHVRKHLEGTYRVIEACDGAEGLDSTREELPDVVISDVIMPEMDGVEMCRRIKHDPELSFIPVILLTARASDSHRIEGLEQGADDYLAKPFSARELKARVANLIAARQRLEARLGADPSKARGFPHPDTPTKRQSRFVERLLEIIDERYSDSEFGVEELAGELHMSRVHLYRRMADELDTQPAAFLMQARLDRAAELLAADAGSVAEVAYGVGFKSVSHFSKRFRMRFEQTPSAYRSAQISKT